MSDTVQQTFPVLVVIWNPVRKVWRSVRFEQAVVKATMTKSAMQAPSYDKRALFRALSLGEIPYGPCFCGSAGIFTMDVGYPMFDQKGILNALQVIRFNTCHKRECDDEARRLQTKAMAHLEQYHTVVKLCAGCGTTEGKLSKCGGCRLVYYCSKACQSDARETHAETCFEAMPQAVRLEIEYALYCWRPDRKGFVGNYYVRPVENEAAMSKTSVLASLRTIDEILDLPNGVQSLENWTRRCFCGARPISSPRVRSMELSLMMGDGNRQLTRRVLLFVAYVCQERSCMAGWSQIDKRLRNEAEEARHLVRICNKCLFVPQFTMQKCGRCMSVYYCSETCQQEDWEEHKTTCCPRE